jgi:GNAT superfamily N-acetyltransferase
LNLTRLTPASEADSLKALDDLLLEAFGFTLADWRARGLWPPDYTCWTIFEDGAALANASVYRMQMLVEGKPVEFLQLGAVATRPQRRGQGLSRRILTEIFAQYPDCPCFLFANPSVLDFYPRFGFRRVEDRQPRLFYPPQGKPSPGAGANRWRKLPPDSPAVADYLVGRAGISSRLDCVNGLAAQMFNLLNAYPGCIYEIPELDVLVAAEQHGSVLTLIDVFAKSPLTFADLAACLDLTGVREIRFGFNPDWLGVDAELATREDDSPMFLRGEPDLTRLGAVPWLVRT